LFKISEVNIGDARQKTGEILDFVGLGDCPGPIAGDLSLFDQHRVSLARALVNRPEFLVLENLDTTLEEGEMRAFIRLVRTASTRFGITAIFSGTHNELSAQMDTVLEMRVREPETPAEPKSSL
jgi:ABC-type branched-subunit amino acid transport system ATPase component